MSALVPHLVLDNTMGAQLIGVVLAAGYVPMGPYVVIPR